MMTVSVDQDDVAVVADVVAEVDGHKVIVSAATNQIISKMTPKRSRIRIAHRDLAVNPEVAAAAVVVMADVVTVSKVMVDVAMLDVAMASKAAASKVMADVVRDRDAQARIVMIDKRGRVDDDLMTATGMIALKSEKISQKSKQR